MIYIRPCVLSGCILYSPFHSSSRVSSFFSVACPQTPTLLACKYTCLDCHLCSRFPPLRNFLNEVMHQTHLQFLTTPRQPPGCCEPGDSTTQNRYSPARAHTSLTYRPQHPVFTVCARAQNITWNVKNPLYSVILSCYATSTAIGAGAVL